MNTKELQINLTAMGYDPGAIDGLRGPSTEAACKELLLDHAGLRVRDIAVAAEQLIMREVGGLLVGPIDGTVGPATRKARKHWLRGPWRNLLMESLAEDATLPETTHRWPVYTDIREVFGEPGTQQKLFYPPFRLRLSWDQTTRIRRFSCHEKVHDSLGRVYAELVDVYGYRDIERLRLDQFGGCLDVRPMRGGTKLSTHAWGIAVDTDPLHNALRFGRHEARLARPEYEPFWDAWTREGWVSLGKARDLDWMHVQACRLG